MRSFVEIGASGNWQKGLNKQRPLVRQGLTQGRRLAFSTKPEQHSYPVATTTLGHPFTGSDNGSSETHTGARHRVRSPEHCVQAPPHRAGITATQKEGKPNMLSLSASTHGNNSTNGYVPTFSMFLEIAPNRHSQTMRHSDRDGSDLPQHTARDRRMQALPTLASHLSQVPAQAGPAPRGDHSDSKGGKAKYALANSKQK